MHQHTHDEGSSLLDQQQSFVSSSCVKKQLSAQQLEKQSQNLPTINFDTIVKIAVVIGIVIVIFWMYSLTFKQTEIKQTQSLTKVQLPPTNSLQQKTEQESDFVIEYKQKPIPSSPSQVPPQQSVSVPAGPNPWAQTETNSLITDKYFFKVRVQRLIQLSDPLLFWGKNARNQMQGLTNQQLEFSLKMLYVVHNVNFKGEIKVEMAPYDTSEEDKQKRIKQLLQTQQKVYQQKYDYQQYLDDQLPFCIVTPSYNNVKTKLYLRNLDSLFMQNYNNYHIVYIDDASPDKTGQHVLTYVKERNIPSDRIQVIVNENNVFALHNIYNAIHYHCNAGQIVMLIDGDDGLVGRQVFGVFNAVYQRTQSALIYSNYLHVMYNEKALIGASSRPIPLRLIERYGAIRNEHAFFTSHLLTFYVDLFRKIKREDLTYENGTFYKYAYDVAMCTPMLEMIGDRLFYLPQITYEYRYDTGQNDPGTGQLEVTSLVYKKKVYEKLESLPFIDDRQNYLKTAPKRSTKPNK